MKYKTDFVTNSSSVSFVVMGARLSYDSLDQETLNQMCSILKLPSEYIKSNFCEALESTVSGTNLQVSSGPSYGYGDEVMIGIHYTDMEDNETLAKFKQRVKNSIKTAIGVDITPRHIEEGWEDR